MSNFACSIFQPLGEVHSFGSGDAGTETAAMTAEPMTTSMAGATAAAKTTVAEMAEATSGTMIKATAGVMAE